MMDVKDLQVELDAEAGVVRAIDQLSLTLRRGKPSRSWGSQVVAKA